MFVALGQFVARHRNAIIVAWIAALVGMVLVAPRWEDVILDGEFEFLPRDADSKIAETKLLESFPDDLLASSIVVVAHRASDRINSEDREFLSKELAPRLRSLLQPYMSDAADEDYGPDSADKPVRDATEAESVNEPIVLRIRDFTGMLMREVLEAADEQASLVIVQLTTDFTDGRNDEVIATIEDFLEKLRLERRVPVDGSPNAPLVIPPGLQLNISGSATVGRDMRRAESESASATEFWTVLLVMALLIIIYRSPLLAIIPLMTVAFATTVSLKCLAFYSRLGHFELFSGIEVYVTVLVYGAGVDYCLFLIARYREELDSGATMDEAVTNCLSKVGAALVASAATVMCGIGMLVFAQFGKFRQAGFCITFGLAVCLLAALTFTPALLRACGRWAFWPNMRAERIQAGASLSPTGFFASLRDSNFLEVAWQRIGQYLCARPRFIWTLSVLLMLPFAVAAIVLRGHLSYGLLSELPKTEPSVIGTRAVQAHFPDGEIGPVTVWIRSQSTDFLDNDDLIEEITENLVARKEELSIASVRSRAWPAGTPGFDPGNYFKKGGLTAVARRMAMRGRIRDYYISKLDPQVTRIDVIFDHDPFARESIRQFNEFQRTFPEILPEKLRDSEIHYVGATASIRDLKLVTDADQIRIDILVLLGVFLILVVLLKRPAISAYLIASVFFSYLATLGVTYAVFYFMNPAEFAGLDWKVPMFLFTILIAVGEDYNIFLMTRIDEEQKRHGQIKGITEALQRTGSIISSCGIIMAGTFSSLLAGSLVGMHQLGFALAFGVLLDTFVVRPVLVPAWLIMLHTGQLGKYGRWLGAKIDPIASVETSAVEQTT